MHNSLKLLRRRWSFLLTCQLILDPTLLMCVSFLPVSVFSTKKPCITYGLQGFVAPNTFFIFLHHFHFCMSLHIFRGNQPYYLHISLACSARQSYVFCAPVYVMTIPIMNGVFALNRGTLRLVICDCISDIKMLLEKMARNSDRFVL